MMVLHPENLRRDGKDFVVLPREEFEAIKEIIQDHLDLLDLRDARATDLGGPDIPLETLLKKYGIEDR